MPGLEVGTFDQIKYIENKISPVDIDITEEISKMCGIIGKFRWVTNQTHPNITGELRPTCPLYWRNSRELFPQPWKLRPSP